MTKSFHKIHVSDGGKCYGQNIAGKRVRVLDRFAILLSCFFSSFKILSSMVSVKYFVCLALFIVRYDIDAEGVYIIERILCLYSIQCSI